MQKINPQNEHAPWLPHVLKQLDAIASLPDGWDSHGTRRPRWMIIIAARRLIECLSQATDLPQPYVNPTPNRGVQFEWEGTNGYFELELVSPTRAEYICITDGNEVVGNVGLGGSLDLIVDRIKGAMGQADQQKQTERDNIGILIGPMTEREAYQFVRAYCQFSQYRKHRFQLQLQDWTPVDIDTPSEPAPRPRDDGDDYPPGPGWEPAIGFERAFFCAFLAAICGVLLAALFLVLQV